MGNVVSSVLSSVLSNVLSSGLQPATSSFFEKAKYIFELEDNLEYLQEAAPCLEAVKADLQKQLKWKNEKVCEHETYSTYGFQKSKPSNQSNFFLTYRYGKDVLETLKKVKDTLSSKPSGEVARMGPPPGIVERATKPTVGLEKMLETTWSLLMEKEVGILGLYGMGGIVVSKNLQVEKIQNDIGERLGICDEAWKKKTQKEKTSHIYGVLAKRRFVMLLDDIWRKVDLEEEIGIPLPSPENGSNVVFTTRSKYVCGRMGRHDVEVKHLDPEKAWELFRQKVRVREWQYAIDVLNTNATSYPEVKDEILKVLKLSYDDLGDETVQQCFKYCALFPEDDEIAKTTLVEYWISEGIIDGDGDRERAINQGYRIIGILISACLLMPKIQNDIGERLGICDEAWKKKTQKEKTSHIYGVLAKRRFVMLLDDIWRKVDLEEEIGIPLPSPENGSNVVFTTRSKYVCGRMGRHDVEVKHLDPEKAWELFRQKVRVREWQYAIDVLNTNATSYPEVKDEILKVLKLSYDDLGDETVQQCFKYCALFPEDDEIAKTTLVEYWISEGIIDGDGDRERAINQGYRIIEEEKFIVKTGAGLHQMPEVKDWNAVRRMSLEKNEIQNISISPVCPNLTTLLLKHNNLESISGEFFLSVPKFVILDLSANKNLTKLPEEVSKLVSLRYLDLSGTRLENLPAGLGKLLQLRYLNLTGSGVDRGYQVTEEFERLGVTRYGCRSTSDICFQNLHYVIFLGVKGVQDLSSLLFAPNLIDIRVMGPSPELEEIICREKVSGILKEGSSIVPFRKLHTIHLISLVELKTIYWERLKLPCLKSMLIKNCPNLKRLPFNKERLEGNDINLVVADNGEWLGGLEWEDEATED
ncbi:hypothetical protein DY000_02054596 [Brassica cretica]|uniref:NB-ARC domain-containing protein n=1 Tax=Brassica cretica TaxID=69181 RepID=A0ABQ7ACW1_BRACR|nr:hypothetical protein DY000_02054596 [Brassica cretica]